MGEIGREKLRSMFNDIKNGFTGRKENPLPDWMLICKILQILPKEYESFKSSWMLLALDNRRSVDLTTQLCTFERNRMPAGSIKSSPQEALAAVKSFKPVPDPRKEGTSCHY